MLSFFLAIVSCKNKAILFAGSKGWINYRFQAGLWASYHELIKRGFGKKDILIASYDDIANNPYNPYRGKIYNDLDHSVNVYYGSDVINYKNNITEDTFFEMLEKIDPTQEDNIFIKYIDHGNIGVLAVPNEEYGFLKSDSIAKALEKMYNTKKFKNCLFAINSCNSGSVGDYVIKYLNNQNIKNIAILASAMANQSSYSDLYDAWILTYVSDEFTSGFIYKIKQTPDCTISELYEYMTSYSKYSKPVYFGNDEIKNMKISDFIGTTSPENVKIEQRSFPLTQEEIKSLNYENIIKSKKDLKEKIRIKEEYKKEKDEKMKLISVLHKVIQKIPENKKIKADDSMLNDEIIVTDEYLDVISLFAKKYGYIRTEQLSIYCEFFYKLTKQTKKENIIKAINEVL